jgi:hypothetical protein
MNRRKLPVMVALAALVASTLAIVYAYRSQGMTQGPVAAEATAGAKPAVLAEAQPKTETQVPKQTEAPKAPEVPPPPKMQETPKEHPDLAPAAAGPAPKVLYDPAALPPPVKDMVEQIAEAAQAGDIDAMLPVLETNELKPMVSAEAVEDPIGFWKKNSADGKGRDVLAGMLNILSSGFVRVGKGGDEMFVWPYFAETDLTKLTPAQEVELYRIVPPAEAVAMKQSGKYTGYRIGISPIGVWHYFFLR